MFLSLVIPVYNALALVKQCVGSVFDCGSDLAFEVIVVDNGSTPDVEEWLLAQERLHANLRHLRYAEPLGFGRAVNAGAATASGRVHVILNSDTVVSPGWLDGLYRALEADPSLGALTPSTNQAGEPAQMNASTIDLPASAALALMAQRSKAPDILHLPQRLTFFCVAIRAEVWRELGGFDDAYKIGNFEDDDFCLRLRVTGYRLGVARHLFVYHHNNATFHANRISHGTWMAQNQAAFAARARQLSERGDPPAPRWPKRAAQDVSVAILSKSGAALERTLRSLANQTVQGFEIVLPGSRNSPSREWIAYVTQGDIFYPFHLEALLDALYSTGSDAVFADGWVAAAEKASSHPDASRQSREAPLLLAGWMHNATLDRDLLWVQSVPLHWPRITWEMQDAMAAPLEPVEVRSGPLGGLVDRARRVYRRSVRLETRLAFDARVRKFLGLTRELPEDAPLKKLAAELRLQTANVRRASPQVEGRDLAPALPPVVMFNAVPWHSAVQRQHHFARGLGRQGHRVFWVETELRPPRSWRPDRPLPEVAPRVYSIRLPGTGRDIYQMTWSPAALDAMSEALTFAVSGHGFHEAVVLVNYPRWQPLCARLRKRAGWKLVYDCLDDQSALADLYQTQLGSFEKSLVEDADLLFASGVVLQRQLGRPAILLPNAADYELFSSAFSMGHLQHLPRPVIGFFGALADWLDTDLIHAAARRFPDFSFVYIGPYTFSNQEAEARWIRGTNLPNVTVLPQLDPRPLAMHLAEFDVCIMPFLDIPVTRTMNAVKLYEYLAAGKPTVSRDLPEVRHLVEGEGGAGGSIALYATPEEFFQRVCQALAANAPELAAQRKNFARRNDWSQRVDVLSGKIAELYETRFSSAFSKSPNARSQE